jgi:hypothetical protein
MRRRPIAVANWELQIALVLLRVAFDRHDLALYFDLARHDLLVRATHDTVTERFADVEIGFVVFFLKV